MYLEVICPSCGKEYELELEDTVEGIYVDCGSCGITFLAE